jgi:hypothetical protein
MNSVRNAVTCNVSQITKDQTIKMQWRAEQKYYSTDFSVVVNATTQQHFFAQVVYK